MKNIDRHDLSIRQFSLIIRLFRRKLITRCKGKNECGENFEYEDVPQRESRDFLRGLIGKMYGKTENS